MKMPDEAMTALIAAILVAAKRYEEDSVDNAVREAIAIQEEVKQQFIKAGHSVND